MQRKRLCDICGKQPSGFGWTEPPKTIGFLGSYTRKDSKNRKATVKHFCSKKCQDIFYELNLRGITVTKDDIEKTALVAAVQPLADYVIKTTGNKGLFDFTKPEIYMLIKTVVEAYQEKLQEIYKEEIPF